MAAGRDQASASSMALRVREATMLRLVFCAHRPGQVRGKAHFRDAERQAGRKAEWKGARGNARHLLPEESIGRVPSRAEPGRATGISMRRDRRPGSQAETRRATMTTGGRAGSNPFGS